MSYGAAGLLRIKLRNSTRTTVRAVVYRVLGNTYKKAPWGNQSATPESARGAVAVGVSPIPTRVCLRPWNEITASRCPLLLRTWDSITTSCLLLLLLCAYFLHPSVHPQTPPETHTPHLLSLSLSLLGEGDLRRRLSLPPPLPPSLSLSRSGAGAGGGTGGTACCCTTG